MVKEVYLINEAAKEVHVESHVLRYWEEELGLPIKRNKQGHRIYTHEDIERFIEIKKLKDNGLQLKAVKLVMAQMEADEGGADEMKEGNPFAQKQLTKISRNSDMKVLPRVIPLKVLEDSKWKENHMIEVKEKKVTEAEKQEIAMKMNMQVNQQGSLQQDNQQEKMARMQYLFQKMIRDVVEDNNNTLIEKITDNVKYSICKEMDYQFRLMEEQEQERDAARIERENQQEEMRRKAEEEHYRHIDELLRKSKSKLNSKKIESIDNKTKKKKEDQSKTGGNHKEFHILGMGKSEKKNS